MPFYQYSGLVVYIDKDLYAHFSVTGLKSGYVTLIQSDSCFTDSLTGKGHIDYCITPNICVQEISANLAIFAKFSCMRILPFTLEVFPYHLDFTESKSDI